MIHQDQTDFFEQAIFQCTGLSNSVNNYQFISGGCINNAVKASTGQSDFFIKWNETVSDDMFEKEALGLHILHQTQTLPVPEVIGYGSVQGKHFIILEYIDSRKARSDFWEFFGQGLAELHRNKAQSHGLDHDNYIGKLPQSNEIRDDGIDFFIDQRLEIQLGLAFYNGLIDQKFKDHFRKIYPLLPSLLPDEPAGLLHGDLWSGNFMLDGEGSAMIIDPAVYYGNREIELAFTQLFGGFDAQFYHAYQEVYPLEPGFNQRVDIYNLYPLLVHVNLFGTSYLTSVERTVKRLLN